MNTTNMVAAVIGIVATASVASAALPADVCQSKKLKITGAYAECRLKADATAALKGLPADYGKCTAKLADKFPATETKAGPTVCPSEGDLAEIQTFVDACDTAIATALAGGDLPADVGTCNADLATCTGDLATCEATSTSRCGNGTLDLGEVCDGADIGGKTCADFGASVFSAPGLSCTSECSLDLSGCAYGAVVPARFTDNGDLTASDLWTGRTWEMKTGVPGAFVDCTSPAVCPDPHDVNNDYRWTSSASALAGTYDGTVKTAFLDVLNDVAGGGANCFAGHCDWRLPTALELKSILLEPEAVGTCSATPCIDASFPGPTGLGGYWSETTFSDTPTFAYWVRFDFGGGVHTTHKTAPRYVRAVRGGL